jgi:hypothetical protein
MQGEVVYQLKGNKKLEIFDNDQGEIILSKVFFNGRLKEDGRIVYDLKEFKDYKKAVKFYIEV